MKFRELCDSAKIQQSEIIIIVGAAKGEILFANEKACSFYGYDIEEMKRLNYKVISSLSDTNFENLINDILTFKTSRYNEKHIVKNGLIKEIEITGLPVKTDEDQVIILILKEITEQKKNQEDLLNFKKAVDTSGEIIFMTDLSGIITYINPAFTRTYGYTKEEIVGLCTPRILKSGKLKEEDYRKLWDKLLDKDIYKGEFVNKTKTGRLLHIEASANPIVNENGEISGFLAIQKDITEKKYFEKKLIENEQRFRQIFDSGPLGMAIIGFNLKILAGNTKLAQILGYEQNELTNHSLEDITVPEDISIDLDEIKKTAMGKIPSYNIKKRYLKKDGEPVWVSVTMTIIKDNLDQPQYLLAMVEDINNQVIAQDELRLSESRYRILAANIPNSIVMLFNKGLKLILAEGPELQRMYKTTKIIEGKYIWEVIPKEDYEASAQYLIDVFEGRKSHYEIESVNGFYDVQIMPIANPSGEIDMGMAVLHNITVQKNNEKRLKELIDSKDKFFSIIAHDLKAPFNSLIGFSEFIANDYEKMPAEQLKLFATNINRAARGVFALLENLLQWSMFQTGRIEFSPSKFKLGPLIEDIQNIYIAGAIRKNINLNFPEADNSLVYADRNMVYTILRNLISNSIKFTKSSGEVGILIDECQDNTKITVYDTGIGMKPEDIEKLFTLDKDIIKRGTDNETGTGLGLILCKEFIERNNGTFTIESKPNKGTRFIFSLPKR